ncbi:class III signal peptide-containing protein [Lentisphaerota bacterium WC36G]|nr:class III signal peptide-containing protein [Lentisphaerae bacterium WC36]
MKSLHRKKRGQGTVEYIIIVVLVAVAAIAVIGAFSDRIRVMFAGAATAMGSDDASDAIGESSVETMQNLNEDGIE